MNTFISRIAVTVLLKVIFAVVFAHGMGWLRSAPQAPMPALQIMAAHHRAGLDILEKALDGK